MTFRSFPAGEIAIMPDFEVVIIGAGPCGLMLANELGRRHIRTLMIEQNATVARAPQANATQARSMEHYRRLGFSQEIRRKGLPIDYPTDVAYFTTYAGYELARHEMPSSQEAGSQVRALEAIWNAAELPHRIPQSLIEETLLKHCSELEDVHTEFSCRVLQVTEVADSVVVETEDIKTGVRRQLRSLFVFAADGAQSGMRKQLGFKLEGTEPASRAFMGGRMLSVYLHAPAFYELISTNRAWMYWTINRRRRALLAATDGQGSFVMQTQLQAGEEPDDLTESDMGRMFIQAVGRDIPFRITGFAHWQAGRALVADRFGTDRVLLGGDAVHLFTPTGGMGYNTAIEDAVNAGWKLAAVLRGQAAPALLSTYETERRPVAIRNTLFAAGFADSIGRFIPSHAIEEDSHAGEAARLRAGAYLAQHGQKEFTIPGFTLGARYDNSQAICDDGTPPPPDAPSVYVPTGKPGGRAPHVWLEDNTSLFDRFGFNWTLLSLGANESHISAFTTEAKRRGLEMTIVDLSNHSVAQDLYEQPLALIRPDQVVGWRGSSITNETATQVFDQLLGCW